eukprot:9432143-Alexandrium_andersonii.AAC.1
MSASLVGSEMCIRDRCSCGERYLGRGAGGNPNCPGREGPGRRHARAEACLLYTSDAADDM